MMDEGILSSVHQLQHRVGYYHISYSVQLCFFVIGTCQQIRLLFVLMEYEKDRRLGVSLDRKVCIKIFAHADWGPHSQLCARKPAGPPST